MLRVRAGEMSRTSLDLHCYSRCPEVQWLRGWPAYQPLLINASDVNTHNVRQPPLPPASRALTHPQTPT